MGWYKYWSHRKPPTGERELEISSLAVSPLFSLFLLSLLQAVEAW
ncbi:unnamed protein product [Spirodela intermedia]|uniref:Uncharacterized protein n=1 Tax=Spirodela intermedia TaxID=51605 RepID=A0A7I8JPJ0_SPIIN|nr:unnamed protein product [Spirodela intermedia]CAA6671352.1 unnamed protein product [Spirodela intermedia]